MGNDTDVRDEDTLRLLRAFFKVRDPEARAVILKLVEDTAAGAKIVTEPSVDRLMSKPS